MLSDEELMILPWHIRNVPSWGVGGHGYCAKMSREFCRRYGIDYLDAMRNGIPAKRLLATNNQFAINLVEFARANPAPEQEAD